MSAPIVRVHNLTKRFGDFTAVDHVSFEIQPGETIGLLGPNGAGKTTTFQMLLGVITPTHGTIEMLGLDLLRHRETILGQVNFSSTYISMPLALTVEENLRVTGRLYGVSGIDRRIDDVIKKLEMEDIRHKVTRKLSSGQMTRLTLAKAVLTEPKILFLDEPTASLIAHKVRNIERRTEHVVHLTTCGKSRKCPTGSCSCNGEKSSPKPPNKSLVRARRS